MFGDQRKNDPTGVYLSDPLTQGQYQGDQYTLVQLQYQDGFAANTLQLSGRLFVGRDRYRSHLSYGTQFSYPALGDWRGAELRLLSTGLANHKLMLGLEAQQNEHQDQAVRDVATPANNLFVPGSGYRIGVYAQDEWRIVNSLSATLGVRLDRNDVTGYNASPRAALIWQALPETTLKALFGIAQRAPNAFERDYGDGQAQVANPDLKGEEIQTLELVADHQFDANLTLRVSVYQWTMHDLVTLGIDPVSQLTQYQSGLRVTARGLELSVDKTWEGGARLRASLSAQNAAQRGQPLLNSPKLLDKLNFSSPLPWFGLHAAAEIRYDSSRLTLNGARLGGNAIANLNLGTNALAKGLGIALNVTNLFDERYSQPAADTNWQNALEQDGRAVLLQADYRF